MSFDNKNNEQQVVEAMMALQKAPLIIVEDNDENIKEEQVEVETLSETDAVFQFLRNGLEAGQSMSLDVLMRGMAWLKKTEQEMLGLLGAIEWAGNIKIKKAPGAVAIKLRCKFKLQEVHKGYENKKRRVEELKEQLQQVNKRLARAEQEVAGCLDSFYAFV